MTSLINKAKNLAVFAHADQKRKYTGEPYFVHLEEVANIVRTMPGATDEMIAAAYLHDVLEDTSVTTDELLDLMGFAVTELVCWLTDVSKPEDGNRAKRKAMDRQHLSGAPAAAQTIKYADIISNTPSIRQHAPKFWPVFLAEKKMLMDVMTAGDAELRNKALAKLGVCMTCENFPRDRQAQEAFVMERVKDGRYRYEAAQFDLYCRECGHGGVWPPEGATDESVFLENERTTHG